MGYTTDFTGSFSLDKPLTAAQIVELNKFSETLHVPGGGADRKPGYNCDWVATEDGTAIEWNGSDKFYDYVEWLVYIIDHFLAPWDYKLNGEVTWRGEEPDDRGKIVVKNNFVTTNKAKIVYED